MTNVDRVESRRLKVAVHIKDPQVSSTITKKRLWQAGQGVLSALAWHNWTLERNFKLQG